MNLDKAFFLQNTVISSTLVLHIHFGFCNETFYIPFKGCFQESLLCLNVIYNVKISEKQNLCCYKGFYRILKHSYETNAL